MMVTFEADAYTPFVMHIQKTTPQFIAANYMVDLVRCSLPVIQNLIDFVSASLFQ